MDVSHELGALRFVVDSPLSSKVAMFNQQVDQHKQSQLLNPFANTDGRASPKPTFSKDEYGKPLAGSLTEMRGQKANMHVLKEMLELCQIIDSEGYNVKDEPTMRVIPFGELFNIYNYISDKVVGILLRARKHKLVDFEGEMLFQRRDDDVPIFLLKPIHEIRHEMEDKIDIIKRCGSPAPQATSVLLDKKAHGLDLPKGATPRSSVSRTPSPQAKGRTKAAAAQVKKGEVSAEAKKSEVVENKNEKNENNKPAEEVLAQQAAQPIEAKEQETKPNGQIVPIEQKDPIEEVKSNTTETIATTAETKTDVNNNSNDTSNDLPTVVIEATAVYEGPARTEETPDTNNAAPTVAVSASSESNNVESSTPVEATASA